jgi:hypothetical protein
MHNKIITGKCFPFLTCLTTLHLAYVKNVPIQALTCLSNLKELNIIGMPHIDVRNFGLLSNLEILRFDHSQPMEDFFVNTNLQELHYLQNWLDDDDPFVKQQLMYTIEGLIFLIKENKNLANNLQFLAQRSMYERRILTPNAKNLGVSQRMTESTFNYKTASFTGEDMDFLIVWTRSDTKVKAAKDGDYEEFWDNEWECSALPYKIANNLLKMTEKKLTIFVNLDGVSIPLKKIAAKEKVPMSLTKIIKED